jgi:hypothetical protein
LKGPERNRSHSPASNAEVNKALHYVALNSTQSVFTVLLIVLGCENYLNLTQEIDNSEVFKSVYLLQITLFYSVCNVVIVTSGIASLSERLTSVNRLIGIT